MDNDNQLRPELESLGSAPLPECCAKMSADKADCSPEALLRRKLFRRLEDDAIHKIRDVFDDMCRVRKDSIELEIKLEMAVDLTLRDIWKDQKVAVDQLYNYKVEEVTHLLDKSKK